MIPLVMRGEDRVRLLETDEDREAAEAVAAKKACMTTKKQICFAVLLCVTLLLMVVIISAEFSFSFSFSADSKKIKLGQQKFFPGVTEEDGAIEYPEFEMPVFSDTNTGVFGRKDSFPEEDRYPAERKLMMDQKEFRLMADWLIEQQRLHGGHTRDFLPEHLKYLAPDPNKHELATTEPAPTTELATTPHVTSSPTPAPSPSPSKHKNFEDIKKLKNSTPKPSEVATVAEEEEEVVSTTTATPEVETHKLEDHDIQVTEEVTAVEVPGVEIIEEVDEPITSKPEHQDSQGFSGGVVQDASLGDVDLGAPDMSPEERAGVQISRGEDQIQPEAEVEAVNYSLDSEAEEVSLQHQVKTGVQISRSGVNSEIQQQAEVAEEVPAEIQGNMGVDSPVGMVTIGETRESAEPLTTPPSTPSPPTTPTPPTTPEPDTSPTPTEEETSTMSDPT